MGKSKKLRPKEHRELEMRQRMQKLAVSNSQPESQVTAETKEIHTDSIGSFAPYPKQDQKKKVSYGKKNGLKSSFVVDSDIWLTAFGNGNSAIIEKKIEGDNILDQNMEQPYYSADKDADNNKKNDIKSKKIKVEKQGQVDMPVAGVVRNDAIGARKLLEEKYYGKNFNDNIHIQIIYNILDIKKIMSVYSNNIIFSLDNLFHISEEEFTNDFIGYMSTRNTYNDFCHPENIAGISQKAIDNIKKSKSEFDALINSPFLGYFGDIFEKPKKQAKGNGEDNANDYKKRVFDIIALLGGIRQNCFHGSVGVAKGVRTDAWMFDLENPDNMADEFRDALDHVYKKRFDKIKEDYAETGGANAIIARNAIIDCFGQSKDTEERTFFNSMYKFTVFKEFKNMGFSIKKLREAFLHDLDDKDAEKLLEKRFDTVRSKLYGAIDYMMFYYYTKVDPDRAAKNVDVLRAQVDDEGKDKFYKTEAKHIWNIIKNTVVSKVSVDVINVPKDRFIKARFKNMASLLDDIPPVNYFVKLIYLMTNFLDGKEINDLVTTLLSKFDNIHSLNGVLKELNLECDLLPDYKMFEKSDKIRDGLDVVKNVARMQKPSDSAKKAMYGDAIQILGVPDEWIGTEKFDRVLNGILGYDDNGRKTLGKGEHGLRNFIVNNVIESNRFKYLIRYNNALKTRALAKNKGVISFALSKLPPEQIEKYFDACGGYALAKGAESNAQKIEWLASEIKSLDFRSIREVDNSANVERSNSAAAIFKANKQAIIGLYLTTMYQITKNLVNINARYSMAFHALQRDNDIYFKTNPEVTGSKVGWTALCEHALHNNGFCINAKNKRYIREDIGAFDENGEITERFVSEGIFKSYRNFVAHLSPVRNADLYINDIKEFHSYYELYHYILQRLIIKDITDDDKVSEKFNKWKAFVERNNIYCKDLTKALNIPFAYNYPRFKNLSIEPLFDMNDMRISKEKKK